MRFLQFFRTNSSNKDAGDLQPKVQEGVGTVVEPVMEKGMPAQLA